VYLYTNIFSNFATNYTTDGSDESTFYWQSNVSSNIATNFPTVYWKSNGSANTSTDWTITGTHDE
jgi:hypothetical protein